jgi:molybdopterin-containing oxidoreductase family molybdopterin binding subunit
VRDDTGLFLRDESNNYLVWDTEIKATVAVAPGAPVTANNPALTGSFVIDGVPVRPAFAQLVAFLADYSPEAAAEITRIPAAQIIHLAEEYAAAKNAFIMAALGLRYVNQGSSYRAIQILGLLTGNIGRKGAGLSLCSQFCSYPIAFNDQPIVLPDGLAKSKGRSVMMADFFAQASSDNSPFKAFISPAGNPVHQQPDRKRWIKIFDQMELVVDFDIWMTDTGELADYVLPDCMPFERMEIINAAQYNHVVLQEPAIEPPPNVKGPVYFWSGLAKRVGLGEYFDKSEEEWLEIRLQSDYPPIATLDPPLTMERLKVEKMVRVNVPAEPKFDPFASLQFPTPSGKAEFYVERLVDLGFALPKYTPCFESPVIDGNNEFPFQLFTGRQRFFMQSMFTDDPITVNLSGGTPATRLNPLDAAAKGLKDGDKVEVYNNRGHVVTNLEIDESVPQGTVHVWFGWRRRQFEEGTYSEVVTPICAPGIEDDVARRWRSDWEAGGGIPYAPLDIMSFEVGSWDAYWDVACNIRRYDAAKGV